MPTKFTKNVFHKEYEVVLNKPNKLENRSFVRCLVTVSATILNLQHSEKYMFKKVTIHILRA